MQGLHCLDGYLLEDTDQMANGDRLGEVYAASKACRRSLPHRLRTVWVPFTAVDGYGRDAASIRRLTGVPSVAELLSKQGQFELPNITHLVGQNARFPE